MRKVIPKAYARTGLSSRDRNLINCLSILPPYFMHARNEGSVENICICRLVGDIATRVCRVYNKNKNQVNMRIECQNYISQTTDGTKKRLTLKQK